MNTLEQLVTLAEGYQQQYYDGNLSAEDFKELIGDLNILGHVESQAQQTERDQLCRTVLVGIVQMAGALT